MHTLLFKIYNASLGFYIPIILITIGMYSCQSVEKIAIPDPLLSEDEMVDIIVDIAILKAAKGIYKKKLEKKYFNLESYIYEKHCIDSLIFSENNKWRAKNLEGYQRIFSRSKKILLKEKELYTRLKAEEDSIKRLKRSKRKRRKRRRRRK